MKENKKKIINALKKKYKDKFAALEDIFPHIHKGSSIFVGTGCGEPQHLIKSLGDFVESNQSRLFGAEIIQVWTLGVAPYTKEKFKNNFRHNSFFISDYSREAVNTGLADFTPVFLSDVPYLLEKGSINIDVALVQVSLPDDNDNFSLGISVDIVKAAVKKAKMVIAQVNSHMPRVLGDTFIHADEIDYIVPFDEPLIEFSPKVPDDLSKRIGKNVAKLIDDGDTLQVGYGSMPNAILAGLTKKKNLGIHTELLTDGIADLMKRGVVNNSKKTVDQGRTIASFCMGNMRTYKFIHDNPNVEFRQIDYTNDPIIIGLQDNMTAINSALQIDLTGQASAESIGRMFFSGPGGQVDFMRGAVRSRGGKSILAMRSTSNDGKYSRIIPLLGEGAGVTLLRGDVHYVVTEYGIAFLHGKNIRERAISLIAIAHPDFRQELIEKAKELGLIFADQVFIPGKKGEYPEHLETFRISKKGLPLLLRPVKISDENLLKDFFYSLSDKSLYQRFLTSQPVIPHNFLQKFVVIDYTAQMTILAVIEKEGKETVAGIGQYVKDDKAHTADVAFAVRDIYHNNGIGAILLSYLTQLAVKDGLWGFTADVLVENLSMLRLFENLGFEIDKKMENGVYEILIKFKKSRN